MLRLQILTSNEKEVVLVVWDLGKKYSIMEYVFDRKRYDGQIAPILAQRAKQTRSYYYLDHHYQYILEKPIRCYNIFCRAGEFLLLLGVAVSTYFFLQYQYVQ